MNTHTRAKELNNNKHYKINKETRTKDMNGPVTRGKITVIYLYANTTRHSDSMAAKTDTHNQINFVKMYVQITQKPALICQTTPEKKDRT